MTQEERIETLEREVVWRDKRIARLQEIIADLAGEVDRLWNQEEEIAA